MSLTSAPVASTALRIDSPVMASLRLPTCRIPVGLMPVAMSGWSQLSTTSLAITSAQCMLIGEAMGEYY